MYMLKFKFCGTVPPQNMFLLLPLAWLVHIVSCQTNECVDDGILLFDSQSFPFAMVSDLDLKSRDPKKFLWRSIMQIGDLVSDSDEAGNKKYRINWGKTLSLESSTANKNRSMELSELVRFEDRLLAMCDYTGLVFKIDTVNPKPGNQPKVFQRWAIADGNGEKVKPCKIEWATVKDNVLYVGSIGKEWTDNHGNLQHRDSEWVKTIDSRGRVRNHNWGSIYAALKYAANVSSYLWHEAIHFDARSRQWFVLPRKLSKTIKYNPVLDEQMGSNVLLIASEDFRHIETRTVGPLQPDRGFTSLRKVPGTEDHFLAIKVREVGEDISSWITVFDTEGNMLLDQQADQNVDSDGFLPIPDDLKFEGLEFVNGFQ